MTKIITGMMVFGLLFLQAPSASKKSERVCYGFVGPVKKAIEEFSPVSGYPYLSPSDRCRVRSQVYDKGGRLIQYSFFTGCRSPKTDPACIFNNFIRQPASRIDDAIPQLQQSRLLLPTLAAALLSAPAHPLQAINGFATDDNNQSSFSISDADAFR